jgi:hypothetical protein
MRDVEKFRPSFRRVGQKISFALPNVKRPGTLLESIKRRLELSFLTVDSSGQCERRGIWLLGRAANQCVPPPTAWAVNFTSRDFIHSELLTS